VQLAKTLRAIAVYEAVKGALVLLTGFGLLVVFHRNIQQIAEQLVAHSHLNPASRFPRIFLDAAAEVTDARLWMFAAFAAGYAGRNGSSHSARASICPSRCTS